MCKGVPKSTLISTRNKPVDVVIEPKDSFGTMTKIASGVSVEISLCQGVDQCTEREASTYGGTVVTAVDIGDGTLSATLQSTMPGEFFFLLFFYYYFLLFFFWFFFLFAGSFFFCFFL
jgi:hypothetical protein